MSPRDIIPAFNLFGETGEFPDIVHCERIVDRAGLHDWEISPHRHGRMAQIFVMERGHAQMRLDGETCEIADNQTVYIPPNVVHGFRFAKGSHGWVLSFPVQVVHGMRPVTQELKRSQGRWAKVSYTPMQRNLIEALVQAFAASGPYRAQRLIAMSQAALATVFEDAAHQIKSRQTAGPQMQRLDDLLARHATDGWRAGEYAGALGITSGHLNRLCRAETGQSASRVIENAVMTEACRLLAFTQLPVAEVGFGLKFHDPAHFSRRFRIVQGETPSSYRARFLHRFAGPASS
ncbi:helix-turn-helix domain-containing protein [Puniceibacterium sp. IMCC21224]|uniref:helix-turn-helix domain-containing protein n=1 Tax=Puniceibacterium sp. IMCC21224 TaxID=1618204 RepID=UPI00064DC53E|nr:helix-turn-helix domain-containing protein [Puniceibacterium sp. IMCC21224]